MVLSGVTTEKKSPVTPPGIDPGTVRLVAHLSPRTVGFFLAVVVCGEVSLSSKVMNQWNYTSTPPYTFIAYAGTI